MNTLRRTTLTLLITAITTGAFRLSYDAQLTLAAAAGINAGLAWIYPLLVDSLILIAMLTVLWTTNPTRWQRAYPWAALALYSTLSILGNALHVQALPPEQIKLPMTLAIAINTIPAITLLIAAHLAFTTALQPTTTPTTATQEPPRSRKPAVSVDRAARRVQDVPPVTDAELLAMADDEGLSFAQIAVRIGRSKSHVGARVKELRDARRSA